MKDLTEIKGQEQAVLQLQRALENNRVSHAYLFLGPEGVGKRTSAYAFATALYCTGKKQSGEICRQCSACLKIEHGNHPDLQLVEPQGKSIKIEQIREIQAQSAFKQLDSRYKIIIIEDAHKMTDEAANCLLKILEEPPKDTIFILLAASHYGILPTIISRCQLIRFKALAPKILQAILRSQAELTVKDAEFLSQLAGGSVSQALKIWENWNEENKWRSPERILELLKRKDRIELLRLSAALEKDPYLQPTLEFLMYWFRDLLVWEKTGCAKLVSNQDIENTKQLYTTEHVDTRYLENAIILINQALKRLKQNSNARLTLDVLFLRLL